MPDTVSVKICGLTCPEALGAAAEAGARYVGFNFFPKSPRYVDLAKAARLAADAPSGIVRVALVVDAPDARIAEILSAVPIDMLQLHGSESPARVGEVKARFGLPVMKAIGISGAEDLDRIDRYADVADQLLIDAKPPKDAVLPGGNGLPFDWRLLAGREFGPTPWMLAGGLTPENVGAAIRMTGARQVDTASGVESVPGEKDPALIRAFVSAAIAP